MVSINVLIVGESSITPVNSFQSYQNGLFAFISKALQTLNSNTSYSRVNQLKIDRLKSEREKEKKMKGNISLQEENNEI